MRQVSSVRGVGSPMRPVLLGLMTYTAGVVTTVSAPAIEPIAAPTSAVLGVIVGSLVYRFLLPRVLGTASPDLANQAWRKVGLRGLIAVSVLELIVSIAG